MRALCLLISLVVAGPAAAADHVLAVTYFDAHSVDPDLEPLGRGVADMLMTDLQRGAEVRVVERTRLNEILAELQLQRSAYIDESTAQRLGRGLGATAVVTGSMTAAIEGMRIDARVVDVETGEVLFSAQATGPTDRFFDLERDVAVQILEGLTVTFDPASVGARTDLTLDQVLAGARRIDEADEAYLARLEALRVYKSRRLVRATTSLTSTTSSSEGSSTSTVITWMVYDGGGTPITAAQFAERVGDDQVADRIQRERRRGTAASLVLLGVGAGSLAAGLPLVHEGIVGGIEDDGASSDPRTVGGIVLLCSGAALLGLFHLPAAVATNRARFCGAFYTPEQADDLIRAYNDALGAELGLDREDVLQLDLQSRRPAVTVRPYLALGALGVRGSF